MQCFSSHIVHNSQIKVFMDEIYLFQITNSNHSIITKAITNIAKKKLLKLMEQHYDENQ